MRKIILTTALMLTGFLMQAVAQETIYVAVLQTQNYIVGARNAPSGFFRYQHDTLWTHLGWKNLRHNGISVASDNHEYIFLAAGNGALRTLDGGRSWRITTDYHVTEVQDVAISPFASDRVYIATAYGVWRSTDRGDNWTEANQGLQPTFTQTIEADWSQDGRVIVGGEGGLFVSTDDGQTWRHIGPDVPVRDVQQCRTNPAIWLAGTEDRGVLISFDGGNNWSFAKGKIARQTIYAVAIDPTNPRNMAAAGYKTGVFLSKDGGKKWKQYKKGLPVLDIHALCFDLVKPGKIWAGTVGAGVYYSENSGEQWQYAGLDGAEIWDMIIIED